MKRSPHIAAASAAVLLLLAGCGDDSDSKGAAKSPDTVATSSDDAAADPSCTDVWKAGATLPEDYAGCVDADGGLQAAVTVDCADGTTFTSYDDRFYAVLGGTIAAVQGEMADDPAYSKFYDECAG